MGPLNWFADNLGLAALTAICLGLAVYLIYAMLHPEEF